MPLTPFCDGFDEVSTSAQLVAGNWTNTGGTTNLSFPAGYTQNALRFTNVSNNFNYIHKSLTAAASFVIGFRFRVVANLTNMGCAICALADGASLQCELRVGTTGLLSVTRNGTALTGGTSVAAITLGTWNYIEWKVTIANSIAANSCQVRLNGNTTAIITVATGQDTQNTSNATANTLYLGFISASAAGATIEYDDLYVFDPTAGGAGLTDFLGDVKVETLLPTGAGTTTQFTPSAGSNWDCVNDTTPDDDSTYVESNTAGQIDTYALSNLSSTPTAVYLVQVGAYLKKTDAGARTMRAMVRSGGADYDSGTDISPSVSYAFYAQPWLTDPATGAAWTGAAVNALEAGVKVTA